MNRRLSVLGIFVALLTCSPALAADKPYEGPPTIQGINCPAGATELCVPLDASFSTVVFNGVGGNGPANPADPCQRNDDDVTLEVALPFTFCLYGTNYTSCFINNNGNISFGASFSEFTSTGFPVAGFPMVAPFWADVDTRNATSGVVHYRIDANRLIVIWDHVGYYNSVADKLNTFELIISDGTDAAMGIGNNVCLCYDDMQWTTGGASGGVGGFGGTPATVGVNKGDGTNFFQIGRFDHAGADYDGPGGAADGVSYLDVRDFCFSVCTTGGDNVPPVPGGFPSSLRDTVCVGSTLVLNTTFISPEAGQTTTTVVDLMGLANASAVSAPGNPSTQTLTFTPDMTQIGDHVVRYTATDDGTPPRSTVVDMTITVMPCNTPTRRATWGKVKSTYR